MDERPGVLTPQQRKQLQQGLASCAACGDKAAYLREIGFPDPELEARRDHTANVIQRALEIDEQIKKGK